MKQKLQQFTLRASILVILLLGGVINSWGEEVTDVINYDATATFLSNYAATSWASDFSIDGVSGAEYYIHSMGTKNATTTALQWNKNGYLYTTKSGETIKSITITTTTTSGNKKIGIYASTSPYNASPTGTAINTLTATSNGATYTFTGTNNYSYIALKGIESSTGIVSIEIVWEQGGTPTPTTYTVTYDANGGTGTMTDSNSYEEDDEVTLLANAFTAPEGKLWSSWSVKDASNNAITVSNGKFSMPASNVTVSAQWADDPSAPQYIWVESSITDLTANDIFVIVGNNYAMTNDNGTSNAPATLAVTIADGKITSTVSNNIKWNVSGNASDGYTFYPNGSTASWLYCNTTAATGSNNNIRVGTGSRKVFVLNSSNYLVTKDDKVDRYLSIYNNVDWRGYINTDNGAVALKFYKRVDATTPEVPFISADNVELAYDAISGTISFSVANPTADGHLTAISTAEWLTIGTIGETVPFTCEANSATTARTATVTLTYTYNDTETVTKEVIVTQAAAPVIYSTIPALFEAATSTATDVNITFGGWVVSAVHNSNAYLTDNQGHGLIIYASEHGFQVNDVLTGTVSCKLQSYRGSAELTNLTSSTDGLSVANNGTVTEQNIAMSELSGVNTGALVSYQNLRCSVTTTTNDGNTYTNYDLTDGTTTIRAYSTLYNFTSTSDLEDGKTYNVTGIYLQYNSTKEIMPRSAADIEEYVAPSHTAHFFVNGTEASSVEVTEGAAITFPSAPADIDDKTFMGWTTAAIDGETDEAPTLITSATMGTDDVTYYAVFATQESAGSTAIVTDELTLSTTGVTSGSSSYSNWSDKTANSPAVYAGNSAGGNGAIQLRSNNNNSGVITTTSGGKATKVVVVWNENTADDRTLNVYGSNTAYTAATDLYGSAAGTLIGTIVKGTSTELNISDDYEYIGLRSASGAMYLSSISIDWATGTPATYSGYCTTITTPAIEVTVGSVGYTTYVTPAAVSFPEGVEAFIVTSFTTSFMHMESVAAVPAGTAVVIKADQGSYTLPRTTETDNVDNNLLQASNGSVQGGANIYVLANKSKGVGFYPTAETVTIPAGKAYLNTGSTSVKEFIAFDFGGIVTGIDNVNMDESDALIFNLAGQRVNKATKGLYIVNGKKVIMK